MKTCNTLCNTLWLLTAVAAVAACDVDRRDIGSEETVTKEDSGTKTTDSKTTESNGVDSGTEQSTSAPVDSITVELDGGTEGDARVSGDANVGDAEVTPDAASADAATDAAADAGEQIVEPVVRGYYVMETDYDVATNVSVFGPTGERVNQSLIASDSETSGLSAALSDDVVAPTAPQVGDTVVLIDRSNGVLTWVDPGTGAVARQVNVAPGGYYANPQDYVVYDADTAFVPRAEPNELSGSANFDQGNDVLVLNPATGELIDSVDLTPAMTGGSHPPFAGRAIVAGGALHVLLVGYDSETYTYATARLVTIDPESLEISNVLVFEGIQNCTTVAVSPNGKSLVLGCLGNYDVDGVDYSAIVHVNVEGTPAEVLRVPASELGGEQINTVAFTSVSTVAYTTFGRSDWTSGSEVVTVSDTLRLLDLATGDADADPIVTLNGANYDLGEIRCSVVNARCLLTDGFTNGGQLRQFAISDDGRLSEVTGDADGHVLPPRYLGAF